MKRKRDCLGHGLPSAFLSLQRLILKKSLGKVIHPGTTGLLMSASGRLLVRMDVLRKYGQGEGDERHYLCCL